MKKVILFITMSMAFLILIGEPEKITINIIILKIINLIYLWLVANNYFYQK